METANQKRTTIVVCSLPRGMENWRPDPFPGSDAAHDKGCTCPVMQPWPGRIAFDHDCPVHELDTAIEVKQ
jgi:hypothetical protein